MNLQAILNQYSERITPAEKQLVRVLFANPTESAFLSATKLAERAGVHPATAVRLAKKLGFRGYPDMREVLREDIVQRSEPAERIRQRLARSESDNILANLAESEIATLREISNHVTQNQIDTVAKTLIAANRIYIFAQGHATALADLMDRRLRRSGHNTVLLKSQGRDLAEHLLTINQNDAVLSFAFHVPPPGLFLVLKQAETVNAKSILISDSLGLSLNVRPTILLAAPRGEESEYQTLTVPMAICNSIVLTLAKLDKGQSFQALDDLSKLMDYIECENDGITQDDNHP